MHPSHRGGSNAQTCAYHKPVVKGSGSADTTEFYIGMLFLIYTDTEEASSVFGTAIHEQAY